MAESDDVVPACPRCTPRNSVSFCPSCDDPQIQCSECGRLYRLRRSGVGSGRNCPNCGAIMVEGVVVEIYGSNADDVLRVYSAVREQGSGGDGGAVAPVFNQYNYGGTVAQGMNVTQHGGVSPAQLPELIRQLRAAASGPELNESQRESVLEDIEVLADEGQDPQTRLSAGQRIRQAFVQGGTAVSAAGIVALLENIAGTIGG